MPCEGGASSNLETSIEILRVTGSPAFAGDDAVERIERRKKRELVDGRQPFYAYNAQFSFDSRDARRFKKPTTSAPSPKIGRLT
jgi:hypothetical protein